MLQVEVTLNDVNNIRASLIRSAKQPDTDETQMIYLLMLSQNLQRQANVQIQLQEAELEDEQSPTKQILKEIEKE